MALNIYTEYTIFLKIQKIMPIRNFENIMNYFFILQLLLIEQLGQIRK